MRDIDCATNLKDEEFYNCIEGFVKKGELIQIMGDIDDDLKAFYFNIFKLHLSGANILNDRLRFADSVMRLDDDSGSVFSAYGAIRTELNNTR